jgi:predicted RNA-binding protein YlxR (DUF448 family)
MAGHIAERTCVGCRLVRRTPELVRLALGSRGQVTLELRDQLPGRGAYLCADGLDCLAQARRRRALSRSLRVGEDAIHYEELGAHLEALREEVQPSPR